MNNLDTYFQVSLVPTTRIHKDHPFNQVIGDLQLATQTRQMTKNLEEYGFFSTTLKQRTSHKDLQNFLFACFLSQEEPKKNSTDEEGSDDEGKDGDVDEEDDGDDGEEEDGDYDDEDNNDEYDEETKDEENFDPILKTPENSDDEGNGEEDLGLNVGMEEGHDEEEEEDKLYRDTTSQMGAQTLTSVAPLPMSAPTITPSTIATITTTQKAPLPPTTAPITLTQDLPNFGSLFGFDNKVRTLEANFFEFMQTNQFVGAVSAIPKIIQRYMDHRLNEAVKVAVQIQSDRLRDEAQKENDEFLKTIDESMQKIIKEQVKEQVKALVEAYESDKIILDTYGETVTLKRRRDDDADKDEPSAGPDRGFKRRREGKEPESASALKEKATRSTGKSTQGTKSRHVSASESAIAEEPMQTTFQMEEPSHLEFDIDDDKLYKFKEGDFKRLRIQDIEDMLLLLVQGKLTNLTVEERFAFNVSLRMFTRSIVIQRRVKYLQLGVESYQKKLNLTKPNTYRSDLKHKEAYTAYYNPRGFIYQNKDKKNRLMRIDELHKFSNGTLTDVRTTLDDRIKEIQMKYLPQSIWRKSDKDRAAAMIQAIDKRLKTRRIMRSLERSILTDLQVTPTKPGRMTKPYSSHCFIANCCNAGNFKMDVKLKNFKKDESKSSQVIQTRKVANSRKHHCRVRPYTREVLVFSINLEIQTKHYTPVFRNRRGDEARIKEAWTSPIVSSNFDNGNTTLLQPLDFMIHDLHWFFNEVKLIINMNFIQRDCQRLVRQTFIQIGYVKRAMDPA
nr:hypothetical protein [Tanacetum cinerariifolium]